jgi:hypothetical protein
MWLLSIAKRLWRFLFKPRPLKPSEYRWRTFDGRRIPMKDLSDSHLISIARKYIVNGMHSVPKDRQTMAYKEIMFEVKRRDLEEFLREFLQPGTI